VTLFRRVDAEYTDHARRRCCARWAARSPALSSLRSRRSCARPDHARAITRGAGGCPSRSCSRTGVDAAA
jgi:hypothetical protein